ncbi:Arc family DNA-binding protein [Brachymonas wangyanguii]|uniref:Arc family DNA-binding protein n=1 Tax=Brachymonas wangyanguii TaxID=3130163 RepID=UPI00307F180C
MNAKPPSRTADQFVVRLPEGMRDRIAEAAKASGRSMNAEIVARLKESFGEPTVEITTSLDPEHAEAIRKHAEKLGISVSEAMRGIVVDGIIDRLVGDPEMMRSVLIQLLKHR